MFQDKKIIGNYCFLRNKAQGEMGKLHSCLAIVWHRGSEAWTRLPCNQDGEKEEGEKK